MSERPVAFITGAGSGIGRATAKLFLSQGILVHALDCQADLLASLHAECDSLLGASAAQTVGSPVSASLQTHVLDVADELAWLRFADEFRTQKQQLTMAVNCAGISYASPIERTSYAEWKRVMGVNLDGVFFGTRCAVSLMREHALGGSILNIASVSGFKPQPLAAAYCASKAAVIMFTRSVALECGRRDQGIKINSLSPGGVTTPIWSTMPFFVDMVKQYGSESAAFDALKAMAPDERWDSAAAVAARIWELVQPTNQSTGVNFEMA